MKYIVVWSWVFAIAVVSLVILHMLPKYLDKPLCTASITRDCYLYIGGDVSGNEIIK